MEVIKDYNYSKFAKYYDVLENEEINKDFNNLLDRILKKHDVKTILDITCGTGFQASFLVKQGYEVTASDLNKEMLEEAKKKYPEIKIGWHQGDMREVNYGEFDAVISINNAVAHLNKEEFEKAVKNIKKNLKQGGIWIFDIFNREFFKEKFVKHKFIDVAKEVDKGKFVRFNHNTYDYDKGIMNVNQEINIQVSMDQPIEIIKESWDMQMYSKEQLKEIFERNRFEVEISNTKGEELDENNSPSILIIAKKK